MATENSNKSLDFQAPENTNKVPFNAPETAAEKSKKVQTIWPKKSPTPSPVHDYNTSHFINFNLQWKYVIYAIKQCNRDLVYLDM